jgi:hypothetical protein
LLDILLYLPRRRAGIEETIRQAPVLVHEAAQKMLALDALRAEPAGFVASYEDRACNAAIFSSDPSKRSASA